MIQHWVTHMIKEIQMPHPQITLQTYNEVHTLNRYLDITGASGGPLDPDAPSPDHMAYLTQQAAQTAATAASLPADPPEV